MLFFYAGRQKKIEMFSVRGDGVIPCALFYFIFVYKFSLSFAFFY